MKSKSGQVTIFVILAIIIIAGVGIYFLTKSSISEKVDHAPETQQVYNFVKTCLEDASNEVIYNAGRGGGYYFPPELSTKSGIPYYVFNGRNYFPEISEIENEISYFISEKIFFCTKNFEDFDNYEISQGKIETSTEIFDEFVDVKTNYPLFISRNGSSSSKIEDFQIKVPVRFGIVYNSIEEFLNESSSEICLTCLYEIAEKNDLYVEMFDYDESSVVFFFKDENSKLNEMPFQVIFANEY